MTIREILVYPDKRLLVKTVPVLPLEDGKSFAPEVLAICEDMKETVKAYEAEGLAATQLGSNIRAFVIKTRDDTDYMVCINPSLIGIMATCDSIMTEGCLSFPSVNEPVARYSDVRVRFTKETGETIEEDLSGIRAIAFQHELDHLDGILFIQKMGSAQRYLALKKLAKIKQKIGRRFKKMT
jgi:peptide deformylase